MKKNNLGFTLIELLAVITIMGILMIVAIPAVSRTIENSRKDTFVNTVQNYVNGAKNMWAADNLYCASAEKDASNNPISYVSSAVPAGTYYINVDSSSTSVPQLLESGGKSPWGQRHMKGYIKVIVTDAGATGKVTRTVTYTPYISDGVHGVNLTSAKAETENIVSDNLKRGNVTMTGIVYPDAKTTLTCVEN